MRGSEVHYGKTSHLEHPKILTWNSGLSQVLREASASQSASRALRFLMSPEVWSPNVSGGTTGARVCSFWSPSEVAPSSEQNHDRISSNISSYQVKLLSQGLDVIWMCGFSDASLKCTCHPNVKLTLFTS